MSSVRKELASIFAEWRQAEPQEWRLFGLFILCVYLLLGWVFWVVPTIWGQIFVFLVVGALSITRAVYWAKDRQIRREREEVLQKALEAFQKSADELRDGVLEVYARVIEHRDALRVLVPRLEEQLGEHEEILQASKELGEHMEEIRERLEKLLPPGRPRLPTKPLVRSRWRATWRYVKGQWKQGSSSYEEISDWLYRMHPDLNYGPDSLADIIEAGEAGLLD